MARKDERSTRLRQASGVNGTLHATPNAKFSEAVPAPGSKCVRSIRQRVRHASAQPIVPPTPASAECRRRVALQLASQSLGRAARDKALAQAKTFQLQR